MKLWTLQFLVVLAVGVVFIAFAAIFPRGPAVCRHPEKLDAFLQSVCRDFR